VIEASQPRGESSAECKVKGKLSPSQSYYTGKPLQLDSNNGLLVAYQPETTHMQIFITADLDALLTSSASLGTVFPI
jgi:hypothetical protein